MFIEIVCTSWLKRLRRNVDATTSAPQTCDWNNRAVTGTCCSYDLRRSTSRSRSFRPYIITSPGSTVFFARRPGGNLSRRRCWDAFGDSSLFSLSRQTVFSHAKNVSKKYEYVTVKTIFAVSHVQDFSKLLRNVDTLRR